MIDTYLKVIFPHYGNYLCDFFLYLHLSGNILNESIKKPFPSLSLKARICGSNAWMDISITLESFAVYWVPRFFLVLLNQNSEVEAQKIDISNKQMAVISHMDWELKLLYNTFVLTTVA